MTLVNVPTVLEQKLLGTPITYETKLSRRELKTVFYVGRKMQLIACYLPMAAPSSRTVAAHKSYGYDMTKEDGRVSRLDIGKGNRIVAVCDGAGMQSIKILDETGTLAAHYKL